MQAYRDCASVILNAEFDTAFGRSGRFRRVGDIEYVRDAAHEGHSTRSGTQVTNVAVCVLDWRMPWLDWFWSKSILPLLGCEAVAYWCV